MAEGGVFAWKAQRIDTHRGPVASYDMLHKPLPKPPNNMHWVLDHDTREWSLEPKDVTGKTAEEKIFNDGQEQQEPDGTFLTHDVQPTDTFTGICLRYKLTPTQLRRANCFSGTNLNLAPNPLRIPIVTANGIQATKTPKQPTPSEKLRTVRKAYPSMSSSEAKCYLELNDWNTQEALENAKEDGFNNS